MVSSFSQVGQRDLQTVKIEGHEVPELSDAYCPCCNAGPLDGVTGAHIEDGGELCETTDRVYPKDGSQTMCCYCAELLVYRLMDAKLKLACPTEDELDLWKSNSQGWDIVCRLQKKLKQDILESRLRGEKRYAKNKRF